MKLGKTALNVATAGPGLLIAGLAVKNQGTTARTDAVTRRTEVDVEIAQLGERDQLLRGVRERACELNDILERMVAQATEILDVLESEPFDMNLHGARLQAALILVTSVRDVATAPVADEHGNPDENTEQLIFKYRNVHMEAANARSEEPTQGQDPAGEDNRDADSDGGEAHRG